MKISEAGGRFDVQAPYGAHPVCGTARACLSLIDLLPVNYIGRRMAFLLRKPVKKGEQVFYDREIWGLKLRLAVRGNLTEQRWLTMPRFHDVPERTFVSRNLPDREGVFVDVGANAGFYTFWALSLGRTGLKVVAIEPSPTMLERIRFNLSGNGFESQVALFGCAVTAEPGDVILREDPDNLGQTEALREGVGNRVAGRPLLDILVEAGVDRVDVMKIDIEGGEEEVLEAFFAGAPEALFPRAMLCELVGGGDSERTAFLMRHGYRLSERTKMNGMFVRSAGA